MHKHTYTYIPNNQNAPNVYYMVHKNSINSGCIFAQTNKMYEQL